MQSTKKGSANCDFVLRVTCRALIEVLGPRVPRILTDDEASQCRRKPASLDFQPIPSVFLRAAASRHSASSVQYALSRAERSKGTVAKRRRRLQRVLAIRPVGARAMTTGKQHNDNQQNQDADNNAKDFHPTWAAHVGPEIRLCPSAA